MLQIIPEREGEVVRVMCVCVEGRVWCVFVCDMCVYVCACMFLYVSIPFQ